MPNVVLEAMAAGLPVVATDVEGVREVLGPAAAAQIVPFGDTAALAEKLIRFVKDAEIAAEIGAQNRRRVEENFSLSGMVAAYARPLGVAPDRRLTRPKKNFPALTTRAVVGSRVLAGS